MNDEQDLYEMTQRMISLEQQLSDIKHKIMMKIMDEPKLATRYLKIDWLALRRDHQ